MNTQTANTVSRGAKLRTKNTPTPKKPAARARQKAKLPAPKRKESETASFSKQDKLIALLSRPEGATIADLTAATGWQAHSVRGAMSGALKKTLKLDVESEKPAGGDRIYRIKASGRS